jgi:hypothetical protein
VIPEKKFVVVSLGYEGLLLAATFDVMGIIRNDSKDGISEHVQKLFQH